VKNWNQLSRFEFLEGYSCEGLEEALDLFVCIPTDSLSHKTREHFSAFKLVQLFPCQPTKVALESGLYSRSDLANSIVEAGANVQRSWSRVHGKDAK